VIKFLLTGNKMKKLTVLFALFLFVGASAYASDYNFDNFYNNANKQNLPEFAKDMGGLLGSGAFSTGRILGWGGFQLSARGAVMPHTADKDTALGSKDDAKPIVMPWIQGEIGLPFRLDGFIRASSWDGLTIAGGGLKWAIVRPTDSLYSLQPMIVVMGQSGVHKDFSLTQYSADFVVSLKLPYVVPYIGGGVDRTKLTAQNAADASIVGCKETEITPRGTLGVNVKLPSYMDLSVAANYAHYGVGGEASFGVRF